VPADTCRSKAIWQRILTNNCISFLYLATFFSCVIQRRIIWWYDLWTGLSVRILIRHCRCMCREWLGRSKKDFPEAGLFQDCDLRFYPRSCTVCYHSAVRDSCLAEGRFDWAVTGRRTLFLFPLNWCIVSLCLISWFARGTGEKNNCTLDDHSKITGSRQSSAMKPSLWDEGLDLSLSFPWTASLEEGNKQNSARKEEDERNDPRWVASHSSWKMYDIWLETYACSWIFWG